MAKVFSIQAIDKLEGDLGSQKLGELFVGLGYLTRANLVRALEDHRENGGRLGRILAARGYITRLQLYEGLAMHLSLPFTSNMNDVRRKIDRKLALTLTQEEMTQHQAIPFSLRGKTLTILTSEPDGRYYTGIFEERFGIKKINQVVVTDLDIMKLSAELHRDTILEMAVNGLVHRSPEESAYTVFSKEQIAFVAGFLITLGMWLYVSPGSIILSVIFAAQFFFTIPVLFKLGLVICGKIKRASPVSDDPVSEHDLPVYSILVPAFREKGVIKNLVNCIKRLDYPEDKLDIVLILEEGDTGTLDAAKAAKPPANWRFLVCPNSPPQTKLKALNYALNFIRGEYAAVYDAGDMPEPDQLKKAVAAFRYRGDSYISFRPSLNYFNKNENFLAKMGTLDHLSWAEGLLPGLSRAGMPVPFGGASDHFDVKKLKKLGAWDPFNVSDNADLGIRASAEGYKVGIIDSLTFEEANTKLGNWISQNSRRFKGYMQTFLVQCRHPFKSIKAAGFSRWLSYMLLIGGTPAVALLYPVMWLLFALSLSGLVNASSTLVYVAGFNLLAVHVFAIAAVMLGSLSRKNQKLLPFAFLYPLYWALQSLAAYKGLWQLFFKPFYWEKTTHGITKDVPVSQTLDIPDDAQELVVVKGSRK